MLTIITLVLNGEPYISQHLAEFERLKTKWHWIIIEGQAGNTADTSWCKPMPSGLSTDGTSEYLTAISAHPNVTVIKREFWANKTAMLNNGLAHAKSSGVLMQVDSDEMWKAHQLDTIVRLFSENPDVKRMSFFCRYFVGPDLVVHEPKAWTGDWLRAWRFRKDMRFNRHEPPVLNLNMGRAMSREITRQNGLIFNHYSWVQPHVVEYKMKFYGYNALDKWKELQANTVWPCKLKDYFYWADDKAIVDKI
jgi:hypothetical protein